MCAPPSYHWVPHAIPCFSTRVVFFKDAVSLRSDFCRVKLLFLFFSFILLRRGFGFVTYAEQAGVEKVLAQNRHELDSKTVSCAWVLPVSCYGQLF